MNLSPMFGDIFYAKLDREGHVQGGERPVVIVQNNIGNKYSPTVEILPISARIDKAKRKNLPTQVIVEPSDTNGLRYSSVVLGEQVQTINKEQLLMKIGSLSRCDLTRVGKARSIQSPFFYP